MASRRAAQIRPSLRLGAAPIQHLSTAPAAVNAIYAEAPSPLQEFSVVYTDRALNHMSEPFKKAMLLPLGALLSSSIVPPDSTNVPAPTPKAPPADHAAAAASNVVEAVAAASASAEPGRARRAARRGI